MIRMNWNGPEWIRQVEWRKTAHEKQVDESKVFRIQGREKDENRGRTASTHWVPVDPLARPTSAQSSYHLWKRQTRYASPLSKKERNGKETSASVASFTVQRLHVCAVYEYEYEYVYAWVYGYWVWEKRTNLATLVFHD